MANLLLARLKLSPEEADIIFKTQFDRLYRDRRVLCYLIALVKSKYLELRLYGVLTEGKRATSVTASSLSACVGRREKLRAARSRKRENAKEREAESRSKCWKGRISQISPSSRWPATEKLGSRKQRKGESYAHAARDRDSPLPLLCINFPPV